MVRCMRQEMGTVSQPRFSAIIPTAGRPGLERTIRGIRDQGGPDRIQILVIGDSHGEDFRAELNQARVLSHAYRCVYAEHDGGSHCYGQAQRNAGMAAATGEWLTFSQDDDVYAARAFDAMDDAIETQRAISNRDGPRPLLFQTRLHHADGRLVWDNVLARHPIWPVIGNIDADCIVAPNVKDRLGVWGPRYLGDYDFIISTLELWNREFDWVRRVIAEARPPHA